MRRDLDFTIAPINATKIEAVNGPFVLGMDRSDRLARERHALYAALHDVDLAALARRMSKRTDARLDQSGVRFDAIADYARPLAASTAMDLFGITRVDEALFAEVARAIFAHTFLNLGDDATIEGRALAAAPLLREWLERAIAEQRKNGRSANNLLAQLMNRSELDDDGIRRTLGGMLVGSIDTTVTAFAKIVCIACDDPPLGEAIGRRWRDGGDIYGLCLEALRQWPHNPILLRSAAIDTKLAGTPVMRGDRVVLWTQAAMLDPQAFPDPDRLIADRPRSAYLHFGAGLHPCAGRGINAIQLPRLVGPLLAQGFRHRGRLGWAGPFPDRLPVELGGSQ